MRATRLAALDWTPAAVQVRARVGLLRATLGDEWPDLSDGELLRTLDDWLAPHLVAATSIRDVTGLDLATILRRRLPWPLARRLDELAPPSWTLPNGRAVPIDYAADRPTAAVRVQDVFGTRVHPSVAGGRVPLTLALLSPADRPLQVTADLPGFWAGTWADVRKELAGRYPKHRWPADPANEPPGRQRPAERIQPRRGRRGANIAPISGARIEVGNGTRQSRRRRRSGVDPAPRRRGNAGAAATSPALRLVDDTHTITVDVPAAWTDVDTARMVNNDGTLQPCDRREHRTGGLHGRPRCAPCPACSSKHSRRHADTAALVAAVPPRGCTDPGRSRTTTGRSSASAQLRQCGGRPPAQFVIAATRRDGSFTRSC